MIATIAETWQSQSYRNMALGYLAKIKMTTEPASTEDPSHVTSTAISRPSAPAKAHKPQSSQHRPFPLQCYNGAAESSQRCTNTDSTDNCKGLVSYLFVRYPPTAHLWWPN